MAENETPRGTRPPGHNAWLAGSTLGAGIVLAAVLLVIVNYFGWKYHQRFDWTRSRLYTLSEKTENVLASLDRDVEVVVFAGPGGPNAPLVEPVTELLARYEAASPHFTVRVIDPLKSRVEAERLLEQYGTRYVEGSLQVVFDAAGERRAFSDTDLAERDYSAMQFGGAPTIEAFKGEELFTGALVELSSGEQPKVLFTTGHGELPLNSLSGRGLENFQELLGHDNVETEEWASLGQPEVPAGTDLVVVVGPTASFIPPELAAFGHYLDGGGRMLWLLDPLLASGEAGRASDLGLGDWLAGYGVTLGEDLVVDPERTVPFYGAETFFLDSYGTHPTVKALSEAGVPVIFSLVRSVRRGGAPDGLTVTEIVRTSPDGWGETSLSNLQAIAADEADTRGPVGVAVAVEKRREEAAPDEGDEGDEGDDAAREAGETGGETAPGPEGTGLRLVVVGDSDFAADGLIASGGNAAFLDNTLNWLLARESFLGIPPKKPEQVRLDLRDDQLLIIILLVALLPLLSMVGGVVVYFRRRR